MTRSLWLIVSTVALANLLAFAGFAGWLGVTGRLSADRIERVRAMLAETIEEENARLEAERAAAAADAAALAMEEDSRRPPVSTQDRLTLQAQHDTVMQQQLERARETLNSMRNALAQERAKLDADTAAFLAEREAFDAMRARIAEIEGDEQFAKAVGLYESMRPGDAANALRILTETGQTEQVVSYLDAMDPRKASKIIGQFEPVLAAGLLERLRTRGLVVAGPEEP